MSTITRYPTPFPVPFCKAVEAGGHIYLSGQLAVDAQGRVIDGDVVAQARLILERIAAVLSEAGARMADVVRVNVWLRSLDDFAAFNAEYARHFPAGFPARSLVQAELYGGAAVEIEVQAWRPA